MAYTKEEWDQHLATCKSIITELQGQTAAYFATTGHPTGGDTGDSAISITLTEGQIDEIQTQFESRAQIVINTLEAGFVE